MSPAIRTAKGKSRVNKNLRVSLITSIYYSRLKSVQRWIDPTKVSAFASIRRYQKLAYRESRGFVAAPQLHFHTRYGQRFTFKEIPLDVRDFTTMFHNIHSEMKNILEHDLLFDMTDGDLGVPVGDVRTPDDLGVHTSGYGLLGAERQSNWLLMKHIMGTPELKDVYIFDDGEKWSFKKEPNLRYLRAIHRFKQLMYFLIHCLAGMPKRLSEERRFRIVNTRDRMRNVLWMLECLAILGLHNKTSANSGCDKMSLHFIAPCMTSLIRRFYSLVATHEAYLVERIVDNPDPRHACYMFSSMGQRWTCDEMTTITKQLTEHHLGHVINTQQLRHILPGIADHYNVGHHTRAVSIGTSIKSVQLGHGDDTDERLYARTDEGHPKLTSKFTHDSHDYSESWQQVWGFDVDVPQLSLAQQFQSTFGLMGQLPPGRTADIVQHASIGEKLHEIQADLHKAHEKIDHLTTLLLNRFDALLVSQHPDPAPRPTIIPVMRDNHLPLTDAPLYTDTRSSAKQCHSATIPSVNRGPRPFMSDRNGSSSFIQQRIPIQTHPAQALTFAAYQPVSFQGRPDIPVPKATISTYHTNATAIPFSAARSNQTETISNLASTLIPSSVFSPSSSRHSLHSAESRWGSQTSIPSSNHEYPTVSLIPSSTGRQ